MVAERLDNNMSFIPLPNNIIKTCINLELSKDEYIQFHKILFRNGVKITEFVRFIMKLAISEDYVIENIIEDLKQSKLEKKSKIQGPTKQNIYDYLHTNSALNRLEEREREKENAEETVE